MQSKMLKLLLSFVLIATFGTTRAQQYLDNYFVPDTTQKTALTECMRVFNYFTANNIDTLYSKLHNDTNVVSYDTLKKYSKLHKESYSYTNQAGKNVSKWNKNDTAFYVERTYVGIGDIGDKQMRNQDVLVLKVFLEMLNGVPVIAGIEFSICPVTPTIQREIINKRPSSKLSREQQDFMNKTPIPKQR